MELEFKYNDKIFLRGEVKYQDDSFSHPFGTEIIRHLELKSFHVMSIGDDCDIEVTEALEVKNRKLFDELRDKFLERARLFYDDVG